MEDSRAPEIPLETAVWGTVKPMHSGRLPSIPSWQPPGWGASTSSSRVEHLFPQQLDRWLLQQQRCVLKQRKTARLWQGEKAVYDRSQQAARFQQNELRHPSAHTSSFSWFWRHAYTALNFLSSPLPCTYQRGTAWFYLTWTHQYPQKLD